jgi:2-dehydro-3-deoxygluconokinase
MSIDLICMGEPMLEFNQQTPGADGRMLYLEGFGGDTSNAAVAAARAGASVAYVTAVGRDEAGARFIDFWRGEGIDTSAVLERSGQPTASYVVTHGKDGHAFLYYRAGSAASFYAPADVPTELIANAKILFASGISQGISNSAADAVFHAIDIARAAGVRVAYDTNYRPRLWPKARAAAVMHAAVAHADIALPSLEDAVTLTGLTRPSDIVDFYLRMGPSIVVLKLGAQGALLGTADGQVAIPPHPCTPIDGTGAGDTFCGSFLARLLAGDTPLLACQYAGAAAAIKTEGYGAVAPMPRAAKVMAALGRAT